MRSQLPICSQLLVYPILTHTSFLPLLHVTQTSFALATKTTIIISFFFFLLLLVGIAPYHRLPSPRVHSSSSSYSSQITPHLILPTNPPSHVALPCQNNDFLTLLAAAISVFHLLHNFINPTRFGFNPFRPAHPRVPSTHVG